MAQRSAKGRLRWIALPKAIASLDKGKPVIPV